MTDLSKVATVHSIRTSGKGDGRNGGSPGGWVSITRRQAGTPNWPRPSRTGRNRPPTGTAGTDRLPPDLDPAVRGNRFALIRADLAQGACSRRHSANRLSFAAIELEPVQRGQAA